MPLTSNGAFPCFLISPCLGFPAWNQPFTLLCEHHPVVLPVCRETAAVSRAPNQLEVLGVPCTTYNNLLPQTASHGKQPVSYCSPSIPSGCHCIHFMERVD